VPWTLKNKQVTGTTREEEMMKPNNQPAIEVSNLTKRYGEVVAVNDISFQVSNGELFGFLGPNGAGKTTTINLLTGLARLDAGAIRISGIECTRNPKAAQHLVGTVPDESNLYPELTGFENLCFCAALYGMRKNERQARARELLDTFGLTDAADRKFAGYSKGMKRKLTFAAGIIHQPPILFLDEPTTGIDVASARQVRQIIAELHRQGTTVFLTTHYIEEAERLCERIAFIVNGHIVQTDRTADLLKPIKGKNVLLLSVANTGANLSEEMASAFPGYQFQSTTLGQVRVESAEPADVGPLVRFMEERGIQVTEARRHLPSLEDVFVQVTGIEAGLMMKEKEKAGGGGNQ
jgi:ABC-2 type transport system ATP-binding protein